MFSTAEKTYHATTVVRQNAQQQTFFRKADEETFFGSNEKTTFFNMPVQTKLTISHPDDPQEKEADEVAESVMRMPEPDVQTISHNNDEDINCKEEVTQKHQPKNYDSSPFNLSLQDANEEEKKNIIPEDASLNMIHRFESEEKDEVKTKVLYRKSDESFDKFADNSTDYNLTGTISGKTADNNISFNILRNGRGPPITTGSFEANLLSSQNSGTALPDNTRKFMESRFNADFSGIRIHTGNEARTMSNNIHAHAFAYANNIYFNEGKYSPDTGSGKLLLAHELTHTIQQGASPVKNWSGVTPGTINRKNKILRNHAKVPEQLTNAVNTAKTMEGKINANKPQSDGYRTGWNHLLDIFKTTFGENKIISGTGGTVLPGTVAEQDIKKKREQHGVMVVDKTTVTSHNAIPGTKTGSRDAMPSWCGIFVFWALKKSGVPVPDWKLGENMINPEAARHPGSLPLPGDIAYRNAYSHFAIVENVIGNTIKTVNGNTSGDDNLGGQVETREEPLSNWTAFFNPLKIMIGSLGSSEVNENEKSLTFIELQKELFNINRNEDGKYENHEDILYSNVQPKQETGNITVDLKSPVNKNKAKINPLQNEPEELQKKEEEAGEPESKTEPGIYVQQSGNNTGHQAEKDEPQYDIRAYSEVRQGNPGVFHNISFFTSASESKMLSLSDDRANRGPPASLHNYEYRIQGGWFDDAISFVDSATDFVSEGLEAGKLMLLNEARDFILAIPGYRALRVVLGKDPVTGDEITRNGRNFIEAAFDIMPGGNLLYDKLIELGALPEAEQWIDSGIGAVESLVNGVVSRIENFWNNLSIDDLASPTQVFINIGNIIHSTIRDVVVFAVSAAGELLEIVKRWLLSQIVSFIREHTTAYPLLTVIIGEDPVTHEPVTRNGVNILNAILDLGGEEGAQQRAQMEETGTFGKAVDWIDRGIGVFGNLLETITGNFDMIWSIVSIEALMNPVDKFNEIYNVFVQPVTDVLQFMTDTVAIILQFIKEILLQRLSNWARGVQGYYLVTVIIGEDPFTNTRVERNTENIIHGFMSLLDGGEGQFQQMKESGSVDRAAQRIDAAVTRLNMTPASIIQLFINLWTSFSFNDFVHPIETFERIIATFAEPIGRLIAFVIEIVKIIVVVLLEIMNFPFDLISNIINRTISAFQNIKRDPVGFLKNILRAIKQGFVQFFGNIVTHLINGVVGWLMGELRDAGIPELTDFSLRGVIGWVLEVLGISMEKIWEKLAAHPRIGPEKVARIRRMIDTLEGIWTFIQDIRERGISAIWERIQEQLSNLWNVIIDSVKNWVMNIIIQQVTVKLLGMLDPTGIMAVINSCIAIYRAVQSFIRYLREMLEVLNSFVNGIADIAAGSIATAANYLENTMARAMPIVVGFLANQVGLGGVGRRIGEMIERAREMIDQAISWLVNKAVDTGMALLDRVMAAGRSVAGTIMNWLGFRQTFTTEAGVRHTAFIQQTGNTTSLIIESSPVDASTFFNQKELEISAATIDETQKRAKLGRITHGKNLLQGLNALMNNENERNNPRIPNMITEIIAIIREIDPTSDTNNGPLPARAIYEPGFFNGVITTSFSCSHVHGGGTYVDTNGTTITVGRNHDAGTDPGNNRLPVAFLILQGMRLTMGSRWVRFHIVNEDFGGRGDDSNLIPTPGFINNPDYLNNFEVPIKNYYTAGLPVWIRATVSYRPELNGVFPLNYTASGGAMKYQAPEWVPDNDRQVNFSRTIPLPQTDVYDINMVLREPAMRDMFIRYTTVTIDMLRILRNGQPSGGYTNYMQMVRVLRESVTGSLNREFAEFPAPGTIPQPTAGQQAEINNLINKLGSSNYVFN